MTEIDPRLPEEDRAFERMLQELRETETRACQRLLDAYGSELLGVEARNDRGQARWAALLPEMSSQEYPVRIQYYDADGLSGHACFASAEVALTEMVRNHYTDPDPGALQRLQDDPRWWESMRRAEAFRAEMEQQLQQIRAEMDLDAAMTQPARMAQHESRERMGP